IEDERHNLATSEAQKGLVLVQIEEIQNKKRQLTKERTSLESEITTLRNQKNQIDVSIVKIKEESKRLNDERDNSQRELNTLKIKIQNSETQIKEAFESSQVEIEKLKAEERSRLLAEREVCLAEIEAFRQKSLYEVESEYRRKEEDLHQQKLIVLKESDEILKEARKAEIQITEEANKRLREATLDAQQRELTSHNRVKEAQEYFKAKEQEADQLIQKSRKESFELTQNT